MDRTEPLERLRAANPVPTEAMDAASSAQAVVLFRRIVAEEPPTLASRHRRRPVRHRGRVVVAALLTASLGGAVAYAVLNREVSKPQSVACFQAADLNSTTEVVAGSARGPEAACADLWAAGVFGGATAPPLVACVLPSGAAGVFPAGRGDDVCTRLGLAAVSATSSVPPGPVVPSVPATVNGTGPPPTAPADVNSRFLNFRDAVVRIFLGRPCVEPDEAQAVVRRELDRVGLGDWTIVIGQGAGQAFSADRPCATLGFRPELHQVVLVPSPANR